MSTGVVALRLIEQESLLQALAEGITVVTANRRLAATLRSRYDAFALRAGLRVWSTPDVLSWQAWQLRCWHEQVFSTVEDAPLRLLTDSQEQLLWERTLRASHRVSDLLQFSATARRAREAASLLLAWQIPAQALENTHNEDAEAFRAWWAQLRSTARHAAWLLPGQLTDALYASNDVQQEDRSGEPALWLYGFDELNPQQIALLERLQAMGRMLEWVALAPQQGSAQRILCADIRAEALCAARWARARLEAHPQASIAIVVPDLQALRGIIVQALDRILLAAAQQPGNGDQDRPYDLSLGPALKEYPLVQTALDLLGLWRRELPLETLSRLLRSPFLAGWDEEQDARAMLDARLRESGELKVSLRTLKYWASREDRGYACPLLAARLQSLTALLPSRGVRLAAGAWVEQVNALLQALGWSRGRSLSSDEYQTLEAWRDTLAQLAGLEDMLGEVPFEVMLGQVQALMTARSFQPQRATVPVQVLGMLETSGQTFDHVWIMGLHDAVWPVPPRPNPFLPLSLQRNRAMPHASAERELQVARGITERLLHCAPEVVVSTPQQHGDQVLRPSPLVESLPLVTWESLQAWQGATWLEAIHRAGQRETITADQAPAMTDRHVRGGSQVFKYQAACPFRAFAELRLGARPLEQAEIGLDSRTRGSLLHRVLETVWSRLGGQQALLDASIEARERLVQQAVEEALEAMVQHYPETLTQRFRAVEQERLQRHTLAWLALECERAPFVSVQAEQAHDVCLGGVEVKVKVDRIDTLPDGRSLLIDYKTGKVEPKQWFGERPEEPQLPLYSAAVPGPIAGVLFGQLQVGNLRFNGVLEEAGLVPQVKDYTHLSYTKDASSWQALLDDWRSNLERLGKAFRAGDAVVDPKDYPKTCRYCALTALCRIHERALPVTEEAEDE